ncbi:MAG TPA: hypothetical protein VGK45_03760, partial [Thermoanaerobaculia bacterium]
CRIPWKAILVANALALLAVCPWLVHDRLLAPLDDTIHNNVPGAPTVADPDRHGLFNDVVLQLLPWEMEVRRALRGGHLPLWSDRLDGGSSPWINPQAGVLSPIANLARWSPIEDSLLVALALKILIACQGIWLLARRLGAGRTAAALAGAGAGLSGAILPWALFPLSSAVAWVPWVMLAGLLLARRPSFRTIATGAVLFAFLLLSGHPESALAGTALAALCFFAWKRRRTPWRRALPAVALALGLGTGLAAPHLIPFFRILPDTQRSVRMREKAALGSNATAPAPDAVSGSSLSGSSPGTAPNPATLLLAPTNPWAFGRPFHDPYTGPLQWSASGAGYAGLLAFAGLLAALITPRCWRRALPLLGFAAVSFLLGAEFHPLDRIVHLIPGLGAVAFNRFLPEAALALTLTGALGLGALLRSRDWSLPWIGPIVAGFVSLTLRSDAHLLILWAALLGGLLLHRARRSGRRLGGISVAVLAVVLLADLLPWGWDFLPTGHRELFYPRTPFVAAATAPALAAGGPWRAAAEGFLFYPALFPVYGVDEVRTHNPVALGSQLAPLEKVFGFRPEGRRYKSAFRNVDHPLFDFLNVRLLVSRDDLPPHPNFERIDDGRFAPLRLYVNPGALPRLFLPVAADVIPQSEVLDAVAAIHNARRVVLLAEEVGTWRPPQHRPWDPSAVKLLTWRPGRIEAELPAAGEKLLATSLPFPAGWTGSAGGAALRRLTVNSAYPAFVVPDGVSRVELSFRPPGLRLGFAVGLLCLVAVAVLAFRAKPVKSRHDGP